MSNVARTRVLVIDDGDAYAALVAEHMPEFELVHPRGQPTPRLPDGPAALQYLQRNAQRVDLVLLDMNFDVPEDRLLPLAEGVSPRRTRRFQGAAILRRLRERHPGLPVVLLTALDDLSLIDADGALAAQSMTYLTDGDDLDALRIRMHNALQETALELEEAQVLWGSDPTVRAQRRRLAVMARGTTAVLLLGETGTGKSFLAEHFIHANSGREGPFVSVDLSTVPRDLVSAQLFGALRGSFTGAVADRKGLFELANGGTLFLDEIQNVPGEVQKQLLLVLESRRVRPLGAPREIPIDVKIVAASNTSLTRAVRNGEFRADLFMRLCPATAVVLPPLRERTDDLHFLATRMVQGAAEEPTVAELKLQVAEALGLPSDCPLQLSIAGHKILEPHTRDDVLQLVIPKAAWQQLRRHGWPGNIRELAMVINNLVTFTLVEAVDAWRSGVQLSARRLQINPGLVGQLLSAAAALGGDAADASAPVRAGDISVRLEPAETLNAVSNAVERQYMISLYRQHAGDFAQMATTLLGDSQKARAVRLRFNQLGLRVTELRRR